VIDVSGWKVLARIMIEELLAAETPRKRNSANTQKYGR